MDRKFDSAALIGTLLAGMDADAPESADEDARQALDNLLAGASASWPALRWDAEGFVAHVAGLLPAERALSVEIGRLSPADTYLAYGCAQGWDEAIGSFERSLTPVVVAAARRLKFSDPQVDELVQRVRMRLLVGGDRKDAPRISGYAGTGALRSWVYAAALRTGLNMLRAIGRAPDGDDELLAAMPEEDDDPRLRYMKELYRDQFRRCFREAVGALEDREVNVLRLYHVDELTLEQIGKLFRVHKTTAMRWLNRAHEHLEEDIRARMTHALELGTVELESVLRMIRSGLHVSLASILAAPPDEAGS